MDNQDNCVSNESNVEEFRFPVPWGHVAGRWWGPKNKQPILAIHGWQDNAGTWDRLIPHLPSTLSVLCIDLPGMGLSSHYPTGMLYYRCWDGVVLIRRMVKHYKWEKICILGHSLGGALAFTYAATFPDEVDRIICIDIASPALYAIKDSVNALASSIDQTLRYESLDEKSILYDSYEDMINIAFEAYKGSISRENCKIMMKRGMTRTLSHKNKPGFYFNRDPILKYASLGMVFDEEALECASRIKCKILNIKAIPSVHHRKDIIYMKVIEKLRENTSVTFFGVKGTHHLHLETPEAIVHILDDFLEDLY